MKHFYIFLLSVCLSTISFCQCNNWLQLSAEPAYVDVGNISIPGTQLTVEAMFNRTQPYDTGVNDYNDGDLVSKHRDQSNVNYLLRPNHAYITTTNGFFETPDACDIELNKTYHVAMVYDGATLKFYRNGYLVSQVAATGALIESEYPTRIGRNTGTTLETFLGYINEVRIWNVAKTQSELQQYINTPLPQPTTQTGLLAYYQFSSLKNLQGNTYWDGALSANAAINQTNPTCAFFSADSCESVLAIVFKDFHGSQLNEQVHLSWTILNATDLHTIDVERSDNGSKFNTITNAPQVSGVQQNEYSYVDNVGSLKGKIIYYRLKITNKDGSISYSNTLRFDLKGNTSGSIISYTNPAQNNLQISCYSPKQETTLLQISDLTGRVVLTQTIALNSGLNSNTINFNSYLSAGLYFLRMNIDNKIFTKKLIIK